jgi:hypothetical protein
MPLTPLFSEFGGSQGGFIPDFDQPGVFPEDQLNIPWGVQPTVSWLDYQCWVEIDLDAGMALHKPLPQASTTVDTLASITIDDGRGDTVTTGVNLKSSKTNADVIQRMATSTYRFLLRGYGARVGYQVPVPGLKSVGGSPAIPDARQWTSGQIIMANFMGIPTFFCAWDLHYIVTGPFQSNVQAPIPPNPAWHIRPDAQLPLSIPLPRALLDPDATQQAVLKAVGKLP